MDINFNNQFILNLWYKDRGLDTYYKHFVVFDVVFVEDDEYRKLSSYGNSLEMLSKIYKAMGFNNPLLSTIKTFHYNFYDIINSPVLIILGNSTLKKFKAKFGLNLMFGHLYNFKMDQWCRWIIATYHPCDILDNINLKPQTWAHLKSIINIIKKDSIL